jgi:hypothetical protein
MAYMRSTIAFGLFWINLFINGLIFFFFAQVDSGSKSGYHSYNLRGTKEKQLISNYNEQTSKTLRNLKADDLAELILYLDIVAMFFVIILMISFCLTKNECCSNDPAVNQGFAIGSCYGTCICCDECSRRGKCNCDCQSSGGSGDSAIGILILFLFIAVFVAIFFAVKACGKHISRIFSVLTLLLLDLGMAGLAIASSYSDTYLTLIIIFSIIGAICNFLGILLPNLSNCQNLSYNYVYSQNLVNNPVPIGNPVTPVAQPFMQQQPVSSDFPPQNMSSDFPPQNVIEVPPEKPMIPVYNDPNQGYNSTSGNIYDAPPVGPPSGYPQSNIYGYVPPPANNYPNPQ